MASMYGKCTKLRHDTHNPLSIYPEIIEVRKDSVMIYAKENTTDVGLQTVNKEGKLSGDIVISFRCNDSSYDEFAVDDIPCKRCRYYAKRGQVLATETFSSKRHFVCEHCLGKVKQQEKDRNKDFNVVSKGRTALEEDSDLRTGFRSRPSPQTREQVKRWLNQIQNKLKHILADTKDVGVETRKLKYRVLSDASLSNLYYKLHSPKSPRREPDVRHFLDIRPGTAQTMPETRNKRVNKPDFAIKIQVSQDDFSQQLSQTYRDSDAGKKISQQDRYNIYADVSKEERNKTYADASQEEKNKIYADVSQQEKNKIAAAESQQERNKIHSNLSHQGGQHQDLPHGFEDHLNRGETKRPYSRLSKGKDSLRGLDSIKGVKEQTVDKDKDVVKVKGKGKNASNAEGSEEYGMKGKLGVPKKDGKDKTEKDSISGTRKEKTGMKKSNEVDQDGLDVVKKETRAKESPEAFIDVKKIKKIGKDQDGEKITPDMKKGAKSGKDGDISKKSKKIAGKKKGDKDNTDGESKAKIETKDEVSSEKKEETTKEATHGEEKKSGYADNIADNLFFSLKSQFKKEKLPNPKVVDVKPKKDKKKKNKPKSRIKRKPEEELVTASDIELNNLNKEVTPEPYAKYVKGIKVVKTKPPIIRHSFTDDNITPMLFKTELNIKPHDDIPSIVSVTPTTEKAPGKSLPQTPKKKKDHGDEEPKGITRYALSDRTFIDKGWTMLPIEKVVRKMNVYKMRPAHPEFDWFARNKSKCLMKYDSGEKFAQFDDKGRGKLFYKNGRVALDYYDAEELNAQQRFVVFSNGQQDDRGRAPLTTVLATFDYLGNGVVFDHSGKIRLKYNQTEGVILDKSLGPVSNWKWHSLNDPPVLQQVMIDTHLPQKDQTILSLGTPGENKPRVDNEEMLAIEFDNFIKEKSKKLTQTFKPFQIKMKALKINDQFSLRVLDQASVYLIFRDGSTNVKLNLGMILDHQEIVDTDTAEVGEVSNSIERQPARTDSLAALQRSVAHAQRVERARMNRESRLRPTVDTASLDRLTAAVSRPLKRPLMTVRSSNRGSASEVNCPLVKCRSLKPCSSNLYYDTRLI